MENSIRLHIDSTCDWRSVSFRDQKRYGSFCPGKQACSGTTRLAFPIVWTILYVLMGIASYLVYTSNLPDRTALTVYAIQLIFNFMWSIFFFNMQWYLFAFFWLILLWLLILYTIRLFYQISRPAGYLMIPYLLWVTFAGYLNYAIYLMNP